MICALVGVKWVFPETVKEVLLSWRGPFVGKKGKRYGSLYRCTSFGLFGRKEIGLLLGGGGVLDIQKLKNSFVCILWGWARMYSGERSLSLIGSLEWLVST